MCLRKRISSLYQTVKIEEELVGPMQKFDKNLRVKRAGSLEKVTGPTQVPSIAVQNNFSPAAGSFDF